MVVYHLVVFKFRANITAEETAQFIAGIGSLKQIDGVISAQCGEISTSLYPSYNDRTKGYTHSLVVVLKDSASLQRYDSSPFHEKIKQDYILPLIDKTAENPYMAFDYLGKLPENESDNSNCCKVQCSYHWVTALAVFAAAGYAFLRYKSRL